MRRAVPFGGLGVALVTLLHEDGSVDAEATAAHGRRLVDLGVRIVLVCGSTGEAWALSPDERVGLVTAIRSALPASVAVLAGTGADGVADAVGLTAEARDAGADAILALSPPGSADLAGYYTAIAVAAGPLPLLAYHFPTMSAPGIPLEVLARLPVAGLKDSTRDVARVTAELTEWDGSVFAGSASMLGLVHSLGGAGAILALANCEPELCLAALAGDAGAQGALDSLGAEANRDFPLGVKELTARRFGTSTRVRSVRPRA